MNILEKLRTETQKLTYNAKKNFFTDSLERDKKKTQNFYRSLSNSLVYRLRKVYVFLVTLVWRLMMKCVLIFLNFAEKINNFYTTVAWKLVESYQRVVSNMVKLLFNNFYSSKGILPDSFFYFQWFLKTKFFSI